MAKQKHLKTVMSIRQMKRVTLKRCLDGFAMIAEKRSGVAFAFLTASTDNIHEVARHLRGQYCCEVRVRRGPRASPQWIVWQYDGK